MATAHASALIGHLRRIGELHDEAHRTMHEAAGAHRRLPLPDSATPPPPAPSEPNLGVPGASA